jgi:hypothetical protein
MTTHQQQAQKPHERTEYHLAVYCYSPEELAWVVHHLVDRWGASCHPLGCGRGHRYTTSYLTIDMLLTMYRKTANPQAPGVVLVRTGDHLCSPGLVQIKAITTTTGLPGVLVEQEALGLRVMSAKDFMVVHDTNEE